MDKFAYPAANVNPIRAIVELASGLFARSMHHAGEVVVEMIGVLLPVPFVRLPNAKHKKSMNRDYQHQHRKK